MKVNKLIIIICIFIFILFTAGSCWAEEENFNQDVSILDENMNGKITESQKIQISEFYLRSKNIKNASHLEKTTIYKIKYLSDGLEVVGFIVRPKEIKKFPVIIFNRGGNQEFGKITKKTLLFLSDLSSKGYVIVASQYRGNDGGEGKEEFGGKDVNDVLNLIPLIKSLDFTRSNQIGMLGVSRGAMMSYVAIKKDIDVEAAVVLGGVSDQIEGYERRSSMRDVMNSLIGCTPQECREEYIKRSAYYWPEEIDVPLLLLHGKNDWRVKVSQAKKLAKKLDKLDKEYKMVIYDDKHTLDKHYEEWTEEMFKWFNKYLDK